VIALSLAEVAAAVDGKLVGADPEAVVHGPVVADSRTVTPGALFVAIAGARADGHEHAGEAFASGAVACLGARPVGMPTVVVDDPVVALGRLATAREHLHEGIRLTQETGDLANLVYLLEALAVVEGATGQPHRVAVLLGAADAVREVAGGRVYGYYKTDETLRASAAQSARDLLGEDVYGDSVDAGRGLTADEAVTYALTGTGQTATTAASVQAVYGN